LETSLTYGALGVVLGVLLGIMGTISAYSWSRNRAQRRALRAAKRHAKSLRHARERNLGDHYQVAPAYKPAPVPSRRESSGDSNGFLDGPRNRPTFNPNPGPRDW